MPGCGRQRRQSLKLIITGGGTGGHVFPALEVARFGQEDAESLEYVGSQRGIEGAECGRRGIAFHGLPSQPLTSLKGVGGWIALMQLVRATAMAKRLLKRLRPDVVLSTGGYSSAPVIRSARSMGIPYVLHEQNSIPGRSISWFAEGASAVAVAFESTIARLPKSRAVHTGQPIRRELRLAADRMAESRQFRDGILVVGGSQGAQAINRMAPEAFSMVTANCGWSHIAGKRFEAEVRTDVERKHLPERYQVHGFLEVEQMANAYGRSKLAISRSGGTVAELAAFRIPSVLIPLPTSAQGHQDQNAREFENMGAAVRLPESELSAESLATMLNKWLDDEEAYQRAVAALAAWDVPDAAMRVYRLVLKAAGTKG